ncbi:MAG: hypothetical protein ACLRX2_12580 [Oscillospiraceae bacterium]
MLNDLSLETIHLIGEGGYGGHLSGKAGGKELCRASLGGGQTDSRSTVQGWEGDPGVEIRGWLENYLAHVKRERFTGKTLTDAEDLRRELEGDPDSGLRSG